MKNNAYTTLALTRTLIGVAAILAAISDAGAATLQLYYSFDSASGATVPDLSGNGRNGTLVNGATINTANKALGAGSAFFAGTEDAVVVPAFNLTNQISIAAFVRLPNVDQIQAQFIATNATATDVEGFRFYINSFNSNPGDDRLALETWGASVVGTYAPTQTYPDDTSFHHLAAVIDRTALTALIYLDGLQVASGSARNDFNITNPIWIGNAAGTNVVVDFNGNIDEFRVYSGLLTPSEVAALAVPEPGSAVLLVAGAVLLGRRRRR